MAWIDSAVADASKPPEYSKDDPPQRSPPSYSDAATQTDPPVCHRTQLLLNLPINSSDGQAPCVVCGYESAIAAVNLRCGHSICAFHLSFFVDGLRTWQAQQGLPPALSVSNPQESVPSTLTALQVGASSPQAAADGVAPATAGGTPDTAASVLPSSDVAETQGISVIAPGETTHASTPPTLTSLNNLVEDDNSPFIDPDTGPVTPQSPPQLLAPITGTPAPAAISTPPTPAQATALPSPRASSPDSISSGSSSTSYDSWTSREAALAHDITAAFERLEFGDGAEAPNEEVAIEVGDNEAEHEGVANEAGQEDVVAFFSGPDSDIEMTNAEDDSD